MQLVSIGTSGHLEMQFELRSGELTNKQTTR